MPTDRETCGSIGLVGGTDTKGLSVSVVGPPTSADSPKSRRCRCRERVGAGQNPSTELALSPSVVLKRDSKLTATYRLRQMLMAEGDAAHVIAVWRRSLTRSEPNPNPKPNPNPNP